jgi:hypothetical protein
VRWRLSPSAAKIIANYQVIYCSHRNGIPVVDPADKELALAKERLRDCAVVGVIEWLDARA